MLQKRIIKISSTFHKNSPFFLCVHFIICNFKKPYKFEYLLVIFPTFCAIFRHFSTIFCLLTVSKSALNHRNISSIQICPYGNCYHAQFIVRATFFSSVITLYIGNCLVVADVVIAFFPVFILPAITNNIHTVAIDIIYEYIFCLFKTINIKTS